MKKNLENITKKNCDFFRFFFCIEKVKVFENFQISKFQP